MHMKTKWLKRLTAAALSIGMAFAPAVAGVRTDLCRCEGSGAGRQDYGSLRFGSDSG